VIPRYTLPEMAAVWSDEAKLAHWLRIEVLAVQGWARIGRVPDEDARAVAERKVKREWLDAKLHELGCEFVTNQK